MSFTLFFKKSVYLFLVLQGLHCCMRAFSSFDKQRLLCFVAVGGLLTAVASLVAHGLQ